MSHAALLMATTATTIAVFLYLAVYTASHNPRRSISWIFSLLCLAIAGAYLINLFMVSRPATPPVVSTWLLRLKWVGITVSAVLYFHLTTFYFSRAWQPFQARLLALAYLAGTGLTLGILLTGQLIAGPDDRPAPHAVGPNPGPYMPLLAAFLIFTLIAGLIALIISYRAAQLLSLRRHITYLLIPTGLVLAAGLLHWANIFGGSPLQIPHELPDAALVLAMFICAIAVVRHGSFVGRPLTRRNLFYTVAGTTLGLAAVYFTLALDGWLAHYTDFPYPVATGILVLLVTTALPGAQRHIVNRLDKRFFPREDVGHSLSAATARALVQTSAPDNLVRQMLEALCAIFNVRQGFVAFAGPSPSGLTVRTRRGLPDLPPGDQLDCPPPGGSHPHLITSLAPELHNKAPWKFITLVIPFKLEPDLKGLIALGEKYSNKPYSPEEIAFCADFAGQVEAAARAALWAGRRDLITHPQRVDILPLKPQPRAYLLEIKVLGPMEVIRRGKTVSESDWVSEKAKMLLAYLLWKSPASASRDQICEALWPDRAMGETANVFHVTLHRLRRVLQPDTVAQKGMSCVQCERGRYYLDFNGSIWLDKTEFESLVATNDPACLSAAVDLYRGPFLEDTGWNLPPEVEVERRRLEQLYITALRRLIALEDGRQTATYLEKLLLVEPSDEVAQRALLQHHLERGRLDLAQAQLNRWQQILAELQVEPPPEVIALWKQYPPANGHHQNLRPGDFSTG